MKLTSASFVSMLFVILTPGFAIGENQGTSFSGRVNRVWEDGFQLKTRNRTITVDSYDICGDNTTRHIAVGNRVTVTGEFEDGEFDAFSIIKADKTRACK